MTKLETSVKHCEAKLPGSVCELEKGMELFGRKVKWVRKLRLRQGSKSAIMNICDICYSNKFYEL